MLSLSNYSGFLSLPLHLTTPGSSTRKLPGRRVWPLQLYGGGENSYGALYILALYHIIFVKGGLTIYIAFHVVSYNVILTAPQSRGGSLFLNHDGPLR